MCVHISTFFVPCTFFFLSRGYHLHHQKSPGREKKTKEEGRKGAEYESIFPLSSREKSQETLVVEEKEGRKTDNTRAPKNVGSKSAVATKY